MAEALSGAAQLALEIHFEADLGAPFAEPQDLCANGCRAAGFVSCENVDEKPFRFCMKGLPALQYKFFTHDKKFIAGPP